MKRRTPWRLAGTGVVTLLVVAGLMLLLANLYVQSHGVQERLRRELSAALRMPVEVHKTTFTPWEGLRIDGIQAAPADGGGEVQLSAESFRARLALWPLLRERRVEISDVLFDRPTLAWTQTESGRWRWPGGRPVAATPAAVDPAAPPPTATTQTPSEPASADENTVPDTAGKSRPRPRSLPVSIRDIRVRHGHLELRNHRGIPVARCEEVNADGNLDAPDQGSGILWMKRLAWGAGKTTPGDFLSMEDFRAPFTYDEDAFKLVEGRGRLASGDVRLDGSLRPRDTGTPFELRAGLENVSLAALLNRAGLSFDLATGQVAGDFTFSGLAAAQNTHVGQGHLQVAGGELHGIPMLASVGEALGIEELRRLKLEEAHADYHLNGANLRLEPLVLAARNLRVDATGDVRLDRAGPRDAAGLDVQARLTLTRAITRQLPQFVENNFTTVPDSPEGARYLDFHVGGSVQNPRSDLIERALGKGSLRGVLEDFFGSDKPKDKKKKIR